MALLTTLTGIPLISFFFQIDSKWLVWLHIVAGWILTVLFLLFTQDHLMLHKKLLFTIRKKSITGTIQITICLITLGTGFILYLYGSEYLSVVTEIHLAGTFILIASSLLHYYYK